MFSGLMLSQYTADTQVVEQRILSAPSFVQSIPAAADQEDFVSMGMNSALKTRQIVDNSCGVLGIELIAAAQALDFRQFSPGRGTLAAKAEVRRHVDFLDEDRPLHRDHNAMLAVVRENRILDAVESEIGPSRDLLTSPVPGESSPFARATSPRSAVGRPQRHKGTNGTT